MAQQAQDSLSRSWNGWSTTLGMKKSQGKFCTAVRNIGQWPNGWTGNLEECISTFRIKFCMHKDNDNMHIMSWLTTCQPSR
jgi:hypothetical protein